MPNKKFREKEVNGMKKYAKAFACVALGAVAGVSCLLAGCGGGGGGGGFGPGDSTITDEWWSTTGELQKNGDEIVFNNVELRLTTVVTGSDMPEFNTIITRFNREYLGKIGIVVSSVTEESYNSDVAKLISNNANAPDILMTHLKEYKSLADSKLIQPFDEVLETSGIDLDLSNYASGLAQYSSLNFTDRTFAVPVDMHSIVVLYNKELLGEHELPETNQELLDLCAAVKAEGVATPIAASTHLNTFYRYIFCTAILQNGGEFFDANSYNANWSSGDNLQAYKDATSSIRSLITSGAMVRQMSESDALSSFLNDQSLFYFVAPWDVQSVLNSYSGDRSNIGGTDVSGWFALDTSKPEANYIFGDSHAFAMSKTVTDITKKAAICEFIKWFSENVDAACDWANAGHMSTSKLITESSDYQANEMVANYLSKFFPDIDDFQTMGLSPYAGQYKSYLEQLYLALIQNDTADSDEALIKQYETRVNDEISAINMQ